MIPSLRQTLRNLRRSPIFTLTVLATLAVGIGLNTTIFTVVDNVLLRPLGYRNANRIVAIRTHFSDQNRSIPRVGGDDYNDLARDLRSVDATAHYSNYSSGLGIHGSSVYVSIAPVSPRFMQVMGVEPLAGRLFNPSDSDGSDALLSAAFARREFGSPLAAIGQSLTCAGKIYTVVGVLPQGFSFPDHTVVWLEQPAQLPAGHRTSYNDAVIARRRAGVSSAQLAAELATFSKLLQRIPEDKGKSLIAVSLQREIVGEVRPTLLLLMSSVAVLLLIVCANLTHLQLVRATEQLRPLSIRTALGASRLALASRALTETAILAISGTSIALLLALSSLRLLTRLAPPGIPRLAEVHLNLDVLVFSVAVSFVVMLLATLLPLWRSWHADPVSVLRSDSSRASESRGSLRLRNTLIVAETALTLTLSIAAVLLTRQLIAQSHQDLGFQPDRLLTLDTHAIVSSADSVPPEPEHPTPAERAAYQAKLHAAFTSRNARLDATLASVASIPGVTSVAAIYGAPLGFDHSDVSFAVKGRQVFAPPFLGLPDADIFPVTPNFFTTLGIPLLQGRFFTLQDRLDSPKVVLINRALADAIFPGQNPVGQQIVDGFDDGPSDFETIVGVVGNIRSDSPASPATPTIYMPTAQHPYWADDMQLIARTSSAPSGFGDIIRNSLRRSHPEIAVRVTTMDENLGEVQRPERFRTSLFILFAAVSVFLAALGTYGVTAYTIAQRRFEFGLRLALGSTRRQVLSLVLRRSLVVTTLGIVLGGVLCVALHHIFSSLLQHPPALDLSSSLASALLLLAVAALATFLPARRAAHTDPARTLRSE